MVFCKNNPAINKGSVVRRPVAFERYCRGFLYKIGLNSIGSLDHKIWIF
jgi:hypothetical protein